MKKNLIAKIIAVAMTVTTIGNTVMPMTAYALPAVEQKIAKRNLVDIEYEGKTVTIVAYNIDGFNYFRIAEICAALNMKVEATNTEWHDKPEDTVGYITQAVSITPSKSYEGRPLEPAPFDNEITVGLTKKVVAYGLLEETTNGFNYKDRNWYQLNDIAKLSQKSADEFSAKIKVIATSYTENKTKGADSTAGKITITTTEK